MSDRLEREHRFMIELGRMDAKVIMAALHTIADQDADVLVAKTLAGMPGSDPDDVTANALVALMTSKDLLGYLAEVLVSEYGKDV